jgi:hypothetical protein
MAVKERIIFRNSEDAIVNGPISMTNRSLE